MKLKEFKTHILEAIEWAKNNGIRVRTGLWGVKFNDTTKKWVPIVVVEPECCPIGTVFIKEQPPCKSVALSPHTAARALGVEPLMVEAFVDGVDGICEYSGRRYRRWHQFGKEVREMLVKKD